MIDKLKSLLPPKRKMATMIAISLASSFMVFIYTPFDLYLHNPAEFTISWRFMLPPLAVTFLLASLAITFLLVFLWHSKTKPGVIIISVCAVLVLIARFVLQLFLIMYIYFLVALLALLVIWILLTKLLKESTVDLVMLLMWGFLAAAYIQTLFLNNEMTAMMGLQEAYDERSAGNILNLLIWVAIVLVPLCLFIVFKVKKKTFNYEKVFVLSLVIISGMQIAGLVSTAVSTELPEGYDQEPVYFTHNAAVNFNRDENIIVFVIDTLDTALVSFTFKNHPHFHEALSGFTYFENNTSEYFDTVASVTSMLTQHHILPWESGWTYIERAWDRHTLIDTLRENGYSTNLFLDRICTFSRYEFIRGRVDNTIVADKLGVNLQHFLPLMTRLSLGRLSPYLLKNTWLYSIWPDFSRSFFYLEEDKEDTTFVPIVGTASDMRFQKFLRDAEFTADREKSFFMFMHLNGSHSAGDRNDPGSWGYHYNEETGLIVSGGDQFDITRANFEMFSFYFDQMKEIGVYDNSTIIILGDHGFRRRYPETTALLIKPKGADGPMVIDTLTELSHLYFPEGIMDAAGIPHKDSGITGISYFDIINNLVPVPQKRIIYVKGLNSTTPNGRIYGDYGVWEITGDANSEENWTFVPWDPLDFFPSGIYPHP